MEARRLIGVRNLSVRFGPVLALDNIDLDIQPGIVHALAGQNGSGKSTLLKVIGGAQRPTPVRKGRPSRREYEYVRHGTASLVASLDVATGKARARDIARNDAVMFISFLQEIDESIEQSPAIHVVLDNGSSHTSKATRAWLAKHPRFVVHHTPAHASWLNQVECFFSILTHKLLRRGKFSSREDLVMKMLSFIEHHSERAKPFKWVYAAKVAA